MSAFDAGGCPVKKQREQKMSVYSCDQGGAGGLLRDPHSHAEQLPLAATCVTDAGHAAGK